MGPHRFSPLRKALPLEKGELEGVECKALRGIVEPGDDR